MSSTGETEPTPEEAGAPPERLDDEDAMRYPGHDDPDAVREQIGLGDRGRPEPEGAPRPRDPDRGAPRPGEHGES